MSSNPFATRFIRPGAIPFLFLDGNSAAAIVERLKANNWRGQIMGEHGSGKSTLVATLVPVLKAAGREVVAIKIAPGERRLPSLGRIAPSSSTQLIIDGYEQLSWLSRWQVRWFGWRCGAGLLVTAHEDARLPTIYATNATEEIAAAVAQNLAAAQGAEISRQEIANAYRAAAGNVRETLFKLFDVYQARNI